MSLEYPGKPVYVVKGYIRDARWFKVRAQPLRRTQHRLFLVQMPGTDLLICYPLTNYWQCWRFEQPGAPWKNRSKSAWQTGGDPEQCWTWLEQTCKRTDDLGSRRANFTGHGVFRGPDNGHSRFGHRFCGQAFSRDQITWDGTRWSYCAWPGFDTHHDVCQHLFFASRISLMIDPVLLNTTVVGLCSVQKVIRLSYYPAWEIHLYYSAHPVWSQCGILPRDWQRASHRSYTNVPSHWYQAHL
jgi:hypothetical protein